MGRTDVNIIGAYNIYLFGQIHCPYVDIVK